MRVGVNGWRIQGIRTGIGRYLINIVRHWNPDVSQHETTFYSPVPLDHSKIPFPSNIVESILPPAWPMLAWENLRLAQAADDDVLFCPSYSRPLMTRCRKVVVSILDAVSALYPELFPRSQRYLYNPLYGWSGHHSNLVIAGSEASRQDAVRAWGIPLEKIRTVYLAPAENFCFLERGEQLEKVRQRFTQELPYFLFVGKISGRRSLPPLLQAFSEFTKRTPHQHRLLLVGLNPHNLDLQRWMHELQITDRVVYPGYISDEDLNLVYNAAEALVMPSVYETLSLPVMEAQRTGTPVICLDTSGLRELTGGAAVHISKLEPHLLFEALLRIAEDPDLCARLSEHGRVHSKQFSWERCSRETLMVLEEAMRD